MGPKLFQVFSTILGYPTGYSQPNTPIKWSQKVAVVWGDFRHGSLCPCREWTAHSGSVASKEDPDRRPALNSLESRNQTDPSYQGPILTHTD